MKTGDYHNDCELLVLLAEDSREAFELLYRRYWHELYDSAYQRLKNSQQAEDIVQDIFVSIWIRRSDLHISNLPAYLHAAVRFRVFNYVARNLAAETFYEPFETIAGYQSGADGHLLRNEMLELIRLYVDSLPEKRRQIFLLHLSESFTTREISDRLHITQKTVQNQLGKALQGLRTHIGHLGIVFLFFYFC